MHSVRGLADPVAIVLLKTEGGSGQTEGYEIGNLMDQVSSPGI